MREAGGTGRSHGGACAHRASLFLCALVACASVLTLLLSSSASALRARGHEYSEALSFGSPGSGDGQLKEPSGVAVNEATGDIYVVDSGNNRIVRFNAAHEFVSTWGFGVKDGEKTFEICTSGCKAGIASKGKGALHGAGTIAIDNSAGPSAGDIYVEAVKPFEEKIGSKEVESEYAQFDKFSPTGQLLGQLRAWKGEKFEEPHGVAVGPNGEVWIYNEEYFYGFAGDEKNKPTKFVESEISGEERQGLAVDPAAGGEGGFYVAHELETPEAPTVVGKEKVLHEGAEFLGIPLIEALDTNPTSGVATEAGSGNVFLDHGKSVTEYDSATEEVQTVGDGLNSGTGLFADAKTETVYVADAGAGRVVVLSPEPPGAPQIDELSAAEISETSATLGALIDPHGSATEYAFRYSAGAVPTAGEACSGPCVQVPATPAAIGSGFGDVEAKLTEAHLEGLTPGTVYHYRVYAINHANGTENVVEAAAGELKFKTQATPVGSQLPDGRQYELVSPVSKNGAAIQGLTGEGGLVQASANGAAVTYVTEGAVKGNCANEIEGLRAPEVTQVLSIRGAGEWNSCDIDTSHNEAEGVAPGSAPEYKWFSSDLSLGLVEPFGNERFEHPKLSTAAGERTPYIRHNASCPGTACFEPLATAGNVPSGTEFGSKVKFVAASSDMSHVVVTSTIPLNGEAAATGTNVQNLYVWSGGVFKLINVLPNGEPVGNAALGYALGNANIVRHAISDDGNRYVFTAPSGHLYARDLASGKTVQLDAGEGVVQAPGTCTNTPSVCEKPIFQDASADGSIVFFTDQARLTAGSAANQLRPDLYVCQITGSGCHITDLTPEPKAGESANVQGAMIGASEDGKVAYFVANGGIGGATPGNCRSSEAGLAKESGEDPEALTASGQCTLYRSAFDEGAKTWAGAKPVARLSAEDEFDWHPTINLSLTARVSPNGEWVAFMSDRNLTGYNTRDKRSNRGAEEVYLYDAAAGKVRCASCNPTGSRPEGVFDKEFSGEGIGLLIDRPLEWTKRWLAADVPAFTKLSLNNAYYQSRYLNDQGRVYFNSAESLVPQDKNGDKADVYQYEPLGAHCSEESSTYVEAAEGCVAMISSGTSEKESAFLDASETGDDVFFMTSNQLVASDVDTSYDVYDAIVCGVAGRPACLPPPLATPPACESAGECRPGTIEVPPSGPGASEEASSSNKVSAQHEVLNSKEEKTPAPKPKPLTKAQKLQKALKACHKVKSKNKRHACEASARKKYGSKAKKAARAKKARYHTAGHRP